MIRGKITFILIIILSLLIVSGCVSQEPTGTPTAIPTATPIGTATATVIPTQTQQPGTSVDILNAPGTAVPGKSFDVIWRVNSPDEKTIPHTAIHYGPQSKAEPLTLTSYPDLTQVQSGTIPANFSAKIIINSTGTTYFRAHAIIDGVNYWSPEKIITVSAPAIITITSIPGRPVENSNYTIKWQVSGGTAGDVSKTELLWDFKKGNATVTDYSQSTPSMTGKTPMEFSQTLKAGPSSTIYFRAHAIVDGMEIFSDEKQMTIYPEHETGY
ncbi:hypothetical protein METP3_03523 [Methanosarcinales archaeon]|nr:hypothetical protein METP3_03523 [Methanosarcinales archaeon]